MKQILSSVIEAQILKKLVLSKPINKNIVRTTGRLVAMKGGTYLALESFYADGKTSQKNIPAQDAADAVALLCPHEYKQMNIITTAGECQVKVSGKGKITVIDRIKYDAPKEKIGDHNRKKQYILSDKEPVDFLVALGVQGEDGSVFDKKRSKFKQINRFLELVADTREAVGNGDLYILDLCCGKSYLSFAIYYYFTKICGCNVVMDCVDLKKDVVDNCSAIAFGLGYKGLNFICGDINDFTPRRTPDLTVSLHACDIATDIVLAKALESGSKVIMSTPCCHHEMMGQLSPTGAVTDFLCTHSILKQKFCDAATDSLRCMLLESKGYDVWALELIDPNETPKNVLIKGIKSAKPQPKKEKQAYESYKNVCDALGVEPYLGKLLY